MATYQFTVTESIGIPEQITLTDTSISPDPGLTSRRVTIRLANGNWMDENGNQFSIITYITWSISDASLTIEPLSQSTACTITVNWMTGAVATGTAEEDVAFVEFDYQFAYGLIGDQTSNPGIIQDANYYASFSNFIVNLFCAETAILYDDIYSSQSSMNRNQLMITNENDFF